MNPRKLFDPLLQRCQRLAVRRAEIKVSRVRRNVEGLLLQPVKGQHICRRRFFEMASTGGACECASADSSSLHIVLCSLSPGCIRRDRNLLRAWLLNFERARRGRQIGNVFLDAGRRLRLKQTRKFQPAQSGQDSRTETMGNSFSPRLKFAALGISRGASSGFAELSGALGFARSRGVYSRPVLKRSAECWTEVAARRESCAD